MQLVTIQVFQTHFDARCRPQPATVRRWIENKEIPGMRIGGNYYVDMDALNARRAECDGDDLVAAVLRAS